MFGVSFHRSLQFKDVVVVVSDLFDGTNEAAFLLSSNPCDVRFLTCLS